VIAVRPHRDDQRFAAASAHDVAEPIALPGLARPLYQRPALAWSLGRLLIAGFRSDSLEHDTVALTP